MSKSFASRWSSAAAIRSLSEAQGTSFFASPSATTRTKTDGRRLARSIIALRIIASLRSGRCAVFGAKTRAPSSFCASCALRRSSTVLKGSLMASSSVALLGVAER